MEVQSKKKASFRITILDHRGESQSFSIYNQDEITIKDLKQMLINFLVVQETPKKEEIVDDK